LFENKKQLGVIMIKNKSVNLNNASGFSLVELMVVVAIIGILASVAVPQFQKFTFKARLIEAKAGLTSLYTAEKAFYGEWSQFDARFGVIGYAPEGNYSFNIGFTATSASPATTNWALAGNVLDASAPILATFNVNAFCALDLKRCKNMGTSPTAVVRLPATNLNNGDFAAANCTVDNAVTPPKFTVCASATAALNPENVAVNLAINQSKDLRSTAP
jgi:type IV pilus assembly protein PilA